MNATLKEIADKIRNDHRRAYVRRAMWNDFEKRLEECYQELITQKFDCDTLGSLYLMKAGNARLNEHYNSLFQKNTAYIKSGVKLLGFYHQLKLNDEISQKIAEEHDACIQFGQDSTGKIIIIIWPYKSDLSKVDEQYLIIATGIEPHTLSKKKITKYINIFIKYCYACSSQSLSEYASYSYRNKLKRMDLKYRKLQNGQRFATIGKVFSVLATLVGIILAAIGVWATLLTGNKWPPQWF